jgi:uncharacterized protein YbaR (Trm112 family)
VRLELTEVLACPRCGPKHGLIAVVDRMDGRRIAAGRLDCPNCEERHPIRDAVVYLHGSAAAEVADPATAPADPGSVPLAEMATALLGEPTGPEILLVGPDLGSVAVKLAALRPLSSVLAYADPRPESHDRVHWIVPVPGNPLPLRSARLHGVVLAGAAFLEPAEAARILTPGSRLVILAPEPEAPRFPSASPVCELASDSRAWVGART